MGDHALISPSKAERQMQCSASVMLEEKYPDKTSEYAMEGTEAHMVLEQCLRERKSPAELGVLGPAKDAVTLAYDHVMSLLKPGYQLFVETRVKLTSQCWGTADVIIYGDNTLQVWDYKHGKGIPVNLPSTQLDIYAAAAKENLSGVLGPVAKVITGIIQPRCEHEDGPIRSAERDLEVLDTVVYRVMQLENELAVGNTKFAPSESNCRWCRVSGNCAAQKDKAYRLAKLLFTPEGIAAPEVGILTMEDKVEIYKSMDFIQTFLTAISTTLLEDALAGKPVPGYKLVAGRSNRKWGLSEEETREVLMKELKLKLGDIAPPKLLGPAPIEKMLEQLKRGKAAKLERFQQLVVKPEGKPTLVPESSKKPELAPAFTSIPEIPAWL